MIGCRAGFSVEAAQCKRALDIGVCQDMPTRNGACPFPAEGWVASYLPVAQTS